jgi:hypothetical protein
MRTNSTKKIEKLIVPSDIDVAGAGAAHAVLSATIRDADAETAFDLEMDGEGASPISIQLAEASRKSLERSGRLAGIGAKAGEVLGINMSQSKGARV